MGKPTKEELDKSVEEAEELWPEAFGGDGTRPHITPKDTKELNQELHELDKFKARCQSNAWRRK